MDLFEAFKKLGEQIKIPPRKGAAHSISEDGCKTCGFSHGGSSLEFLERQILGIDFERSEVSVEQAHGYVSEILELLPHQPPQDIGNFVTMLLRMVADGYLKVDWQVIQKANADVPNIRQMVLQEAMQAKIKVSQAIRVKDMVDNLFSSERN